LIGADERKEKLTVSAMKIHITVFQILQTSAVVGKIIRLSATLFFIQELFRSMCFSSATKKQTLPN
jgi:hypothetical protein